MTSHAHRTGLNHRSRAIQLVSALPVAAMGLLSALLRWHDLARQRRQLLSLDDRMLKDIGVTRADARHEGGRPFWDDQGIERVPWR